jgi:hypothetical protein
VLRIHVDAANGSTLATPQSVDKTLEGIDGSIFQIAAAGALGLDELEGRPQDAATARMPSWVGLVAAVAV